MKTMGYLQFICIFASNIFKLYPTLLDIYSSVYFQFPHQKTKPYRQKVGQPEGLFALHWSPKLGDKATGNSVDFDDMFRESSRNRNELSTETIVLQNGPPSTNDWRRPTRLTSQKIKATTGWSPLSNLPKFGPGLAVVGEVWLVWSWGT